MQGRCRGDLYREMQGRSREMQGRSREMHTWDAGVLRKRLIAEAARSITSSSVSARYLPYLEARVMTQHHLLIGVGEVPMQQQQCRAE
jgi:hypothetical protein